VARRINSDVTRWGLKGVYANDRLGQ
jgi:hypothetical protein